MEVAQIANMGAEIAEVASTVFVITLVVRITASATRNRTAF